MNKKNLLLAILLASSVAQHILPIESNPQEVFSDKSAPTEWGDSLYKTATSIISGGLIGTFTGRISSIACSMSLQATLSLIATSDQNKEKTALIAFIAMVTAVPTILIIEKKLRIRLANSVNKGLEEHEINYRKRLIQDTAWIASWMAFLHGLRV
ncbi:MAG TPA: hypothetical protein VHX42_01305 [Candidatus Babeliales bacterium]|nr:hypothetical protein [Candidatus Babeliales bacterium]